MAFKKIDPKETQKLMDAIMANKDEPFDEEEFNAHIDNRSADEIAEEILTAKKMCIDIPWPELLPQFHKALELYKGKALQMSKEELMQIELDNVN